MCLCVCVLCPVKWRHFMHFIIKAKGKSGTRSKIETAIALHCSSALYKLRIGSCWFDVVVVFYSLYCWCCCYCNGRCCHAIAVPLFLRLSLYRTPKSRADFHKYRHLLFCARLSDLLIFSLGFCSQSHVSFKPLVISLLLQRILIHICTCTRTHCLWCAMRPSSNKWKTKPVTIVAQRTMINHCTKLKFQMNL